MPEHPSVLRGVLCLKSGCSLRVVDVVGVAVIAIIAVVSVVSTFVPWRCHVHVCNCNALPRMHWHVGSTGNASGTVRVNRGRWPNTFVKHIFQYVDCYRK